MIGNLASRVMLPRFFLIFLLTYQCTISNSNSGSAPSATLPYQHQQQWPSKHQHILISISNSNSIRVSISISGSISVPRQHQHNSHQHSLSFQWIQIVLQRIEVVSQSWLDDRTPLVHIDRDRDRCALCKLIHVISYLYIAHVLSDFFLKNV